MGVDGDKSDLHALLARQLRRVGVTDPTSPPSATGWADLLDRIDRTYRDAEHDRYLLERALDLTSQEMQDLYLRIDMKRGRLQEELKVAGNLQTSILPPVPRLHGYEVAAQMVPAIATGGDYYDVLARGDGCWVGIGDVAGHGLRAAIVMMMARSMIAALAASSDAASPREILCSTNRALYDTLCNRMHLDEHMTATLLRCEAGGQVRFAGAHEEILVCRAAGGAVELVPTPGTWLGLVPDIAATTPEGTLVLAPGDCLVLYTDGITEALSASGEQFGGARLSEVIERSRHLDLNRQCDAVFAALIAWAPRQQDDMTLVMLRRL